MTLLKSVRLAAVAAAAFLAVLPLGAAHAGPLGDFNVMVFGDFTAPYSDVEGRLYAGGNVSVGSYSVGYNLPPSLAGGDTLVVGGNLQFSGGTVYNGNVRVGGTATTSSFTVLGGTLTDNLGAGGLPVDFAAEQSRLSAISSSLAAQADTGIASILYSTMHFVGDGTTNPQVFSVNAADLGLSSVTELSLDNIAAGTDVVINVTGTAGKINNGGFTNFDPAHVLFNFIDATTLDVNSVQGSILAVNADVTAPYGQINGQVVAGSWGGGTQVNQVPYEGTIPQSSGETPVPVPEPGMAGLMLLSVAGFLGMRRRRRAA